MEGTVESRWEIWIKHANWRVGTMYNGAYRPLSLVCILATVDDTMPRDANKYDCSLIWRHPRVLEYSSCAREVDNGSSRQHTVSHVIEKTTKLEHLLSKIASLPQEPVSLPDEAA